VQAKQVSVGNGTAQLCWRSVIGTNGVLIKSNSSTVSNRPIQQFSKIGHGRTSFRDICQKAAIVTAVVKKPGLDRDEPHWSISNLTFKIYSVSQKKSPRGLRFSDIFWTNG